MTKASDKEVQEAMEAMETALAAYHEAEVAKEAAEERMKSIKKLLIESGQKGGTFGKYVLTVTERRALDLAMLSKTELPREEHPELYVTKHTLDTKAVRKALDNETLKKFTKPPTTIIKVVVDDEE